MESYDEDHIVFDEIRQEEEEEQDDVIQNNYLQLDQEGGLEKGKDWLAVLPMPAKVRKRFLLPIIYKLTGTRKKLGVKDRLGESQILGILKGGPWKCFMQQVGVLQIF